jgi:hypothetical protein
MKPHRTDGVSLSFGLIFLLVAAWWAVSQVVTLRLPALGWVIAGMLILFGTIGLLGAIRSGRRTEQPAPVPAEASVAVPGDLPPELHADIVRELLDDPATRFSREHPASDASPAENWPAPPGSRTQHD